MSATKNQGVTHDVGLRISWNNPPAVSIRPKVAVAEALASKLEDVLGSANHRWYVGKMDAAEEARRKEAAEAFQKRYEK